MAFRRELTKVKIAVSYTEKTRKSKAICDQSKMLRHWSGTLQLRMLHFQLSQRMCFMATITQLSILKLTNIP